MGHQSEPMTDSKGRKSPMGSVQKALDINQCLSNVPSFLMAVKKLKSQKVKNRFVLDENFINSIKSLVQSGKESADGMKKQWLGFLLISQIFDPVMFSIDE